ncbi:MAG: GNAT family N-acetyltransferase [Pirellulaceae bacterium]
MGNSGSESAGGASEPRASDASMSLTSIRPATSKDVDAIVELLRPYVKLRLLLERDSDEIAALMPTGFSAVRSDNQALIGFCAVEIYSKKLAEIQCLAVSEPYRNTGVGGELVQRCVKLAKDKGVMEVMAISSSENFLRGLGFDYSLPEQKRALFYQLRERFSE